MAHHRWIVALSTYLTEFISMGLTFAFPVLFSTVLETFRDSRAKTATIASVLLGVLGCTGIITGLVIQRIGPRKAGFVAGLLMGIGWIISFFATSVLYLVLVLAVPMGIGCSLVAISISRTLSYHFPGKHGQIALSVQATASGVGRIVFTYVLTSCVNTFGLRGTFLIMGAVLLNCSILSILWSTEMLTPLETSQVVSKKAKNNTEKRREENFFMQFCPVLTDKIFLLFLIGVSFLYVPHAGFIIMFADIMKNRGFTEDNIQLAFVIHSTCNVCGRLSFGFLKQIPRVSSLFLVFLLVCMSTISFSTLQFAKQFWTTVIACSVLGFEMGATVTAMSIGTLKLIGPEQFPFGLGLLYTTIGVGNAVVGPISGTLRDVTGSYRISLWTSALSAGVAVISILVAMIMKHRSKPRDVTLSVSFDDSNITKF
ncbi:hypothetical protein ACJMK2_004293 [Sinanodonta woodiana]|uniref:Major facilitator superfamily (MFS) profile domain-containing protein n=1 Tax=Sinanodonta woodiana TaxID=1069815 RepID=A0ABD3Y2K6_SINWO